MTGILRWLSRYRGWLIGFTWLLILAGFWFVSAQRGNTPVEQVVVILQGLQASPYAWLWLLLIYTVRPLTFIPVTILTVFAGFLYGAVTGIILSAFAATFTAGLTYLLAMVMTRRREPAPGGLEQRLLDNSFEAVLTSRLMSVPGDLLNYFAGALRVNFISFLLGTFLGGLPGVVMGVLAGASITGAFSFDGVSIRWEFLVASAVLLVAALLTSRWLRQREKARNTDES